MREAEIYSLREELGIKDEEIRSLMIAHNSLRVAAQNDGKNDGDFILRL